MKRQVLLGSAIVTLGVATGSLLAPQAASALDFTFSFGGVTGLITGLVDNTTTKCVTFSRLSYYPRVPADSPPCVVSVTNAGSTNSPLGVYTVGNIYYPGWEYEEPYVVVGTGFTVLGGVITGYDWFGEVDLGEWKRNCSRRGPCRYYWEAVQTGEIWFDSAINAAALWDWTHLVWNQPDTYARGVPSFEAVPSSVPGPLPLFGAAAAFGFSRQLRKRINATKTTAPTRPAG